MLHTPPAYHDCPVVVEELVRRDAVTLHPHMSFAADTRGSSEMRSARGRRALQPWLSVPLMYLGLMFVAMFPIALTVEDAGWALALYGFALFWALVIGLLAHRWYRVTVIESGADYRVVRLQTLRGAKKASR